MYINEVKNLKFYRLSEVEQMVGLGRSAIYQRIAEGTFPSQIKLGGRAVAWSSLDLQSWMKDRIEEAKNIKEAN